MNKNLMAKAEKIVNDTLKKLDWNLKSEDYIYLVTKEYSKLEEKQDEIFKLLKKAGEENDYFLMISYFPQAEPRNDNENFIYEECQNWINEVNSKQELEKEDIEERGDDSGRYESELEIQDKL